MKEDDDDEEEEEKKMKKNDDQSSAFFLFSFLHIFLGFATLEHSQQALLFLDSFGRFLSLNDYQTNNNHLKSPRIYHFLLIVKINDRTSTYTLFIVIFIILISIYSTRV